MYKNRFFFNLAFLLFVFPFSLYSKTYVAAVLVDFAPLYKVSEKGEVSGLAIDILSHITQENGLNITYHHVENWEDAIRAVRMKKADFIPGVGISSDRETEFILSRPMETEPVSIFVRKSTNGIEQITDLNNRNVAVISKSVAEAELSAHHHEIILHRVSTMETGLVSLMAGEVDAFVLPQPIFQKKLIQTGLTEKIKVVGEPVIDLKRAYLFRKEDSTFVNTVINPALERYTTSQEYMVLLQKWFGKLPEFWTVPRMLITGTIILGLLLILFFLIWAITMQRVNTKLKENITLRMRAEKDLAESEERYRILFEYAPVAIVVADLATARILYINKKFEAMYGYQIAEAKNLTAMHLHPPEAFEEVKKVFEQELVSQSPGEVVNTHLCRKADGTIFTCEVAAAQITMNGVKSGVGFFVDITDKMRFLEEQRQAEKLVSIGQLAGGVAHDFNNQLSGILGYSDILYETLPDGSEQREYIQKIITIVKRATDLTSQLLAFARKGKYLEQTVDIHTLIAEVISLLRHTVDKKINITCDLKAAPSTVCGDASQLQNALLNLALNSRDAMPEGGDLRLATRKFEIESELAGQPGYGVKPGNYIRIDVTDTGKGIPASMQGRIFEPFFTTKEPGKGTGMGLAAVYGTVRSHNGVVRVYSEEAKGTTMSIFLPVINSTVSVDAQGESTVAKPPSDKKLVLVVDDEDIIRDIVSTILKEAGYGVVLCCHGEEARDYYTLNRNSVDLVLLDMVMPQMDGPQTFKALKSINASVKILISSGYSLNNAAQDLLDAGGCGFIQKPFRKKQLLQAIGEALSKKS